MSIYNHPKLKTQRRRLRSEQTDAERLLWSKLRKQQLLEIKFFRQYSVGPYVLDFYAPTHRLGIELDGGQHAQPAQEDHDRRRTEYLKNRNLIVIRFWNNDVLQNIEGIIDELMKIFITNSSQPPLAPRGGVSDRPTDPANTPS